MEAELVDPLEGTGSLREHEELLIRGGEWTWRVRKGRWRTIGLARMMPKKVVKVFLPQES